MKTSKFLSTFGVCALLALNSAAYAQSGNDATGSTGSTTRTETTNNAQRDDGPDLGWLGLLGLAGLAGLMKKPKQEVVHQTEVRTTPTNTTVR
ncbi:MAG TPA: WGxxGxxG family protein [Abditibacterium sp.]